MRPLLALDEAIAAWVHGLRAPGLTEVMRAWTWLGGTVFVTACVLGLAALLLRQSLRRAVFTCVVIVGGGSLLATLAKLVFERARPLGDALVPMPVTHGFPSGHAMASVCLAAACVYAARAAGWGGRRIATVALGGAVYALGVGFSRVYLGVHWPSDVVGSWVLGAAWCAVVLAGEGAGEQRPLRAR